MTLKRSPWIIHYDGSSCNGCDIEVLACLTPVFDVERLGIINTGNPKHADIFVITGSINEQNKDVVLNIYHQMPEPKVVVAVGICASSGGIFAECYNVAGGVGKIIPVDVYVLGCAARPEAIIDGIIKGVGILDEKRKKLISIHKGFEELVIQQADAFDAVEILWLQKLANQSEAELYHDFSFAPLLQTLDQVWEDFEKQVFLKAVIDKKIVGSIRAYQEGDLCRMSRLIIHPVYQGLGIAKRLLASVENMFPQARRLEIAVSHRNKRLIYFYKKLGYQLSRREKVTEKVDRLFFEKTVAEKDHD